VLSKFILKYTEESWKNKNWSTVTKESKIPTNRPSSTISFALAVLMLVNEQNYKSDF